MKEYWRLIKYLWPYKAVIMVTWVISIVVLGLQGITIWIGADFIQRLISGGPAPKTESLNFVIAFLDSVAQVILQQSTPFKTLIAGAVILFVAGVATVFLRVFKMYILENINQTILMKIKEEMFFHLAHQDLSFSKKYRPGEVSSLFTKDCDMASVALINVVDRIFMQPLRLALVLTIMISLSVELTIWILSLLTAGAAFVYFTGGMIERISKKFVEKIAGIQGYLNEYLSSVILSRSMGREDFELNKFNAQSLQLKNIIIKQVIAGSVIPQITSLFTIIACCSLLVVGGYRVFIDKTLDGNVLIKMGLLLPIAAYPVEALATLYSSIRTSVASSKRIFQFIDLPVVDNEADGLIKVQRVKGKIVLKQVSYEVDGISILKNINLVIPAGSKVVIYGPSGSGKTTLLGLIAGYLRCSSGSITIDGINIDQISKKSWYQRLGIVTQEPILLNATLRENLHYAKQTATEEELVSVMKQVLLWNRECVFRNGLDTVVGNRGEIISGGERQRVTIARMLLKNPDVFLMDEPTSMLDHSGKIEIRDTINSIAKSRTLIIVTHDPIIREIADHVINLEEGRIVSPSKKKYTPGS